MKELLDSQSNFEINPRFYYGELRLDRLNKIYTFTLRAPIRGYLHAFRTYTQSWQAHFGIIAAIFAYIILALTAMQVGLETDRLRDNAAFQNASYGFAAFSIILPLALFVLALFSFMVQFLVNWSATAVYNKKRFATIKESATAATYP